MELKESVRGLSSENSVLSAYCSKVISSSDKFIDPSTPLFVYDRHCCLSLFTFLQLLPCPSQKEFICDKGYTSIGNDTNQGNGQSGVETGHSLAGIDTLTSLDKSNTCASIHHAAANDCECGSRDRTTVLAGGVWVRLKKMDEKAQTSMYAWYMFCDFLSTFTSHLHVDT